MFQFKQFTVHQEGSAMKVGTDGVLLGAWCSVNDQTHSVLDIGTGTGLIALMIAQRSPISSIDGIEIEPNSAIQAAENFIRSPWSNRLSVHQNSVQQFSINCTYKYDLIVSNPPFFSNSLVSPNTSRTLARHDNSLPIPELMSSVAKLLNNGGQFSIIVPSDIQEKVESEANNVGLNQHRMCEVYPTINSLKPKRVMMEFQFEECTSPICETLTIELNERHKYSLEYINLTKEFYLKM